MSAHTLSSREFNHDISAAKKAAADGPVFVTARGKFSHVLLTYEEYQRMTGGGPSIVDLLALPRGVEVDFEPPKANLDFRPAEL